MEVWKDVKGYEGIYQVSNYGNIKSLERNVFGGKGYYVIKEKILKQSNDSHGYKKVSLSINGKTKNHKTHMLLAIAFLNHTPDGTNKLVVNHKDLIKTNNFDYNLEIVTNRENCNHKHIKSTSEYTGVSWCKQTSKWRSLIYVDGKLKSLGRFKNEHDAYLAYENELTLYNGK